MHVTKTLVVFLFFVVLVLLYMRIAGWGRDSIVMARNLWYGPDEVVNASLVEILDYLNWKNRGACKVFYEFGGVVNRKPGLTFLDGQKSVCLDAGVAPQPGRCIVYSFGSNGEWSFDEAMEKYGCRILVFDPTTDSWNHKHSKNVWFYALGIGTRDIERGGDPRGWTLATLATLRKRFGHRTIDVLKIDIEGDEWDLLEAWLRDGDLNSVKQLALEVHFNGEFAEISRCYQLLRRLENEAGFVRFFARQNPWTVGHFKGNVAADGANCYEIAWYNTRFLTVKN